MKIKSIYIDGLHNASDNTYELSDLVYFYGRNGAGKSTILQAIQLALLGYIPGGHKTKEAILKHSRDNKVLVRLELDNDGKTVIIERKYDSKSSKTTITPESFDLQEIISDIELPIFNFNEFIGQTANKLKDYFIKNILPTSNGNIDWDKTLREGLFDVNVDNIDEVIKYGSDLISGVEGSPLEQVARANTLFREEQSFVKSELQRLQATIDSLIYYSDYTGPKDISEINSKLLSLGAIRDALIRYDSAKQMIDKNLQELNDAEELYRKELEAYPVLQRTLEILQHQYDDTKQKASELEHLTSEIKVKMSSLSNILSSKGICPYTHNICNEIKFDDIQGEYCVLSNQVNDNINNIWTFDGEMQELNKNIEDCKRHIATIDNLKNKIIFLKNQCNALPDKPNTDLTLAELDFQIEQYNDNKTKLQANQVYESTIENITNLKYKSELNNNALSAWIKLTDTNGLQTSLTVKPFEELANKMTSYIQNMYGDTSLKANFNISTKANSFSFGLIRNEKYIPYEQLSSGEKCLYTLALMICITDNGKSPLKVMLCDDMFDHLDSIAIENTFNALKDIKNIQFIFAGVKDCQNAKDVTINL